MQLLRDLQHWLTGRGPCLSVAEFVPETHPLRQWADTFPWAALVAAVDRSFAQRFPRERLDDQLTAALEAHQRIAHQSRRLTQGKTLPYCKIVNAYDATIAPICKGKSNCPAQFGRKPGIIVESEAGFIFGLHLPVGNPSDASYVQPLIDKVQQAIARTSTYPTPAIRSLAGDLAFNDASLREGLHQHGILTEEIPHTVDPLPASPAPENVLRILSEAGLPRNALTLSNLSNVIP